uniref:Uncharacterized protein n=1 Tax=Panagrolaimus sp. PS1159 TaxID=55785 RepID=A0AC35FJA5_9BILA
MVCWEVKFNKWMFLGLTLLVAAGVAAYPMQYVVYLIQRPTTDEDFTYLLNGSLLDFNGFIPPNGVIEVVSFSS